MDKDKVMALSKLSRIELTDSEAENLSHEFEGILEYVSDVNKALENNTAHTTPVFANRNVLREDSGPHEPRQYTDILLKAAPNKEGDYFKVKKIL